MKLHVAIFAIGLSLFCVRGSAQSVPGGSSGPAQPAGQKGGSIGVIFQQSKGPSDGKTSALVIATVIENGPSDQAGLKPGDKLYSIDGNVLASEAEFVTFVKTRAIGSAVKLGYLRQGRRLEALVTIADREKLYSEWYSKLAEQGDPQAECALGIMYLTGYGKPQDLKLAHDWLSKSADQGDANALLYLGNLYWEGKGLSKDFQEAMKWWTKAAEAGNAEAQDKLGLVYHRGKEVPQDDKQAAQWFAKAAEQGDARGEFQLAFLYYQGNGVAQDYKQALDWYTKSADQGFSLAQYSLGGMYEAGQGTARDNDHALLLFKQAADQGLTLAQNYLAEMYVTGRGVPRDFQQARAWYTKASQLGDTNAKTALAKLDQTEAQVAAGEKELMDTTTQRTIVVDSNQGGPANTLFLQAHDASNPRVSMGLLCSSDVALMGESDCVPLRDEHGGLVGGRYRATKLAANDPLAYKHYVTWKLTKVYVESRGPAVPESAVYALYQMRDAQGNTLNGHLPEAPGTASPFADRGRNVDIDQFNTQTQDKTDEQAVCLQFIQKEPHLHDYNRLANNMPVPTVDCYDHVTYTHVKLTNPGEGSSGVRGIILHDNRPESCGSGGCAVSLLVPACPGNEESCKNSWRQGLEVLGSEIKIASTNHQGWYDVLVTGGTAGVKERTYHYVGGSTYQDVVVIAAAQKKAVDEANARRAVALSLGLHSGESQAEVKAALAANGYRSLPVPDQLSSQVTQGTIWNCSSDGWSNGEFNTSCIARKGGVTIRLLFQMGVMIRDADTAELHQVRTDKLLFAQLEFEKYEYPDNTITLITPALKRCDGKNDRDGVCLNF